MVGLISAVEECKKPYRCSTAMRLLSSAPWLEILYPLYDGSLSFHQEVCSSEKCTMTHSDAHALLKSDGSALDTVSAGHCT